MNDYEIASNTKLLNIKDIASKINISDDNLEYYGKYKAKINLDIDKLPNKNSKLILVTSTSPTPFGEGKTTLSIGINDSLCKIGKNSLVVLREPSLGPVFGTKGGATGGGFSQVAPMDDINLHFTGDIHAITSANNLLSAVIDNHLFQGNQLNIDENSIMFRRCMDVNDRALRDINLNITSRNEKFDISTASEIMAILCLSKDIDDLKRRIGNILIGYTKDGKEVFARDLHCEGALTILLKDAIKPNLVQTLEGNPAIIHGGPFANIAHGCNSIIATKLALKLSDYVVTEAGFGSDMGALKFLDIKCRMNKLNPDLIVINTTIKGLKYNGNDDLKNGICNLEYHIDNMKKFSNHILVVLNKFSNDSSEEIEFIKNYCEEKQVEFEVSECYLKGSNGGINIANKIVEMTNHPKEKLSTLYALDESIYDKINHLCKKAFGASEIIISDYAKSKLEKIDNSSFNKLPICIAKNQYSITDNPKILGYPKNFTMTVTDIKISSGAGFIVIYMGDIMTMPGLSKQANYLNMDIIDNKIIGLF